MTAKKRMPLALWIFVGLLVGIAAGLFLMALPNGGAIANGYIKPWGTIFLNLLNHMFCKLIISELAGRYKGFLTSSGFSEKFFSLVRLRLLFWEFLVNYGRKHWTSRWEGFRYASAAEKRDF